MKPQGAFMALALALLAAPVLAHASCDAVKASIDAKLKAKGLEGYTLAVVSHDEPAGDGAVVGQCEGDKQIVYTKGASAGGQAEGAAPESGKAPAHHHPRTHADMPSKSDEPHPAMSSSSGG
jgi:hypothetical protein